jgi:hypothetical protein
MLEIMRQRHADLLAQEEAKLGRGKREAARKKNYKQVAIWKQAPFDALASLGAEFPYFLCRRMNFWMGLCSLLFSLKSLVAV